jgi:hypothetical protein
MQKKPNIDAICGFTCFVISTLITLTILFAIITNSDASAAILRVGLKLYLLAAGGAISGLVLGIRAWWKNEERFWYQFVMLSNGILLWVLLMITILIFGFRFGIMI